MSAARAAALLLIGGALAVAAAAGRPAGAPQSQPAYPANIAAGGMGVVYRARDERLEREVALKLLPEGSLADPAARARFRNEALALSRLSHPGIATVFDFDSEDGADFLVMEYVPGATLAEK